MTQCRRWVVLLCFFSLFLSNSIFSQTEFRNTRYDINVLLPEVWKNDTANEKRRLMSFPHVDGIATINITVHRFSDPVTMNTLKQQHITSRFDGWQNLLERPGSDEETQLANSDESYVAVYSKTVLDARLNSQKHIAGEYYYLKDETLGYVISILAPQRHWKSIQRSAKQFRDSFYIGPADSRPVYIEKKAASEGWTMIGGDAANSGYSASSLNVQVALEPTWVGTVSTANVSEGSALIYRDHIYMLDDETLLAKSLEDGKISWSFTLLGPISQALAVDNGLLYVIVEEETPTLYALHTLDGSVIFRKALPSDALSAPIVSGSVLMLRLGATLFAFDAQSGLKKWSTPMIDSPDFYAISHGDTVIVLEDEFTISAVSLESGKPIWTQRFRTPVLFSPTLTAFGVLLSRQAQEDEESPSQNSASVDFPRAKISMHSLKDGHSIWAIDLSMYHTPLFPISASDKTAVILMSVADPKQDIYGQVAWAFSPKTGHLQWRSAPIESVSEQLSFRPVLGDQFVLVSGRDEEELGIVGLDINTGGIIPSDYFSYGLAKGSVVYNVRPFYDGLLVDSFFDDNRVMHLLKSGSPPKIDRENTL